MKVNGSSCVIEYRLADIASANNRCDLRQRNIELARFGQLRREESELHLARFARFSVKVEGKGGAEGLQDQKLMDTIYESARTGRAIGLEPVTKLDSTRGPALEQS